jgi:hypothetical protein
LNGEGIPLPVASHFGFIFLLFEWLSSMVLTSFQNGSLLAYIFASWEGDGGPNAVLFGF